MMAAPIDKGVGQKTRDLTIPEPLTEADIPTEARDFVFIQWKGTNVCLDFHCSCTSDDFAHFDGWFAYLLKCNSCGKVWKLPQILQLTEATPEDIATYPDPVEPDFSGDIGDDDDGPVH